MQPNEYASLCKFKSVHRESNSKKASFSCISLYRCSLSVHPGLSFSLAYKEARGGTAASGVSSEPTQHVHGNIQYWSNITHGLSRAPRAQKQLKRYTTVTTTGQHENTTHTCSLELECFCQNKNGTNCYPKVFAVLREGGGANLVLTGFFSKKFWRSVFERSGANVLCGAWWKEQWVREWVTGHLRLVGTGLLSQFECAETQCSRWQAWAHTKHIQRPYIPYIRYMYIHTLRQPAAPDC